MTNKGSNLVFSQYVDKLAQNSECFSFDAYNIGLRRYLKAKSRAGELGTINLTKVDPYFQEDTPVCLLLGETNRMLKRYPIICGLLDSKEKVNFTETTYYKTLWRFYEGQDLLSKMKGRSEIRRKIKRIFGMNRFISNNKTLVGIDAYLRGNKQDGQLSDYPINLIYDLEKNDEQVIQLDGSHRRCICFYNGIDKVQCIDVKLSDVICDIKNSNEPYLADFLSEFKNVIRCFA